MAAEPSPGIAITAWRRLPTVVRAVLTGSLVAGLGTLPWAVLAGINLELGPRVPWSVGVMALYLWAYWKVLAGEWWPGSTAESRRERLRARALEGRIWRTALLTGGLGWAGLVALRIAFDEFLGLPSGPVPRALELPMPTAASYLLMLAVVAGIAEEAGFRGYMQVPLERRHGPVAAILVVSVVFWLAHAQHYAGNARVFLLHGWFYLAASALHGMLAYWTASILPGIVIHAAGDVLGIVLLAGLAVRSGGEGQHGVMLRFACTAAAVLLPAALWAFRRLARDSSRPPGRTTARS